MEIIKTKTVFVEGIDLKKQDDIDKLHDILLEHSQGGWSIIYTEDKNVIECILNPLGKEIEDAGYNWKEYQLFQYNSYKDRIHGVIGVGFERESS